MHNNETKLKSLPASFPKLKSDSANKRPALIYEHSGQVIALLRCNKKLVKSINFIGTYICGGNL